MMAEGTWEKENVEESYEYYESDEKEKEIKKQLLKEKTQSRKENKQRNCNEE